MSHTSPTGSQLGGTPAVWMSGLRRLIQRLSLGQQGSIAPLMTLDGGDVTDGAVAVLVVIPTHELQHPGAGRLGALKAPIGIVRLVLAGAKQRLGERIVVADPGAAVGGEHPRGLQGGPQGAALLGTPIIGMEYERLADTALGEHCTAHEPCGLLGRVPLTDLSADDFAAVKSDDEIEVEEAALLPTPVAL